MTNFIQSKLRQLQILILNVHYFMSKIQFNVSYSSLNNNVMLSENMFRFADVISVGYEVLVEENDQLIPAKVLNISSLMTEGNLSHFLIFYF